MRHWMTQWDPDSGAPYGGLCDCPIDVDHSAAEYNAYLDELERIAAERQEGIGDG